MNFYKKICIIGGSGTGKTTLSENIGKELNIPIYHIDGINYGPNWVERDKNDRDNIILNIIKKDNWVIDGTYRSTLKQRLENAELVIYLDYSTTSQLCGVLKRYIKNKNTEKHEIPGCKERLNLKFLSFVIHWRKNKRNEIINTIKSSKINNLIIFKNRRQLNKWYLKTFNKKINI